MTIARTSTAAHGLSRRWVWAVLAMATIAAGVLVRHTVGGAPGKVVGVALYGVMMTWLVLAVRPGLSTARACVLALLLCWCIEGVQAAGIAAWINSRIPIARWVLGEVFAWSDMVWYAAGVAAAGAVVLVAHQVLKIGPKP